MENRTENSTDKQIAIGRGTRNGKKEKNPIAIEFGRLGGMATKAKHGREHYSLMGRRSAARRWKKGDEFVEVKLG